MNGNRPVICYGITWEPARAVIIRAETRRHQVRSHTVWEGHPHQDEQKWKELLAGIALECDARHAIASVGLPAGNTVARWVTAPFPSLRKARKVVPALLDIQLPFPLESCAYQIVDMHRWHQQVRALGVAARTAFLDTFLNEWKTNGLDPHRVDHEGLALWTQSLAEAPAREEDTRFTALLSTDHHVLIAGQGPHPEHIHSGQIGTQDLINADGGLSDAAVTDFTARLIRIIRARSPAQNKTAHWHWCGPGASNEALLETIETRLTQQVDINFFRHEHPGTFSARALAVRGIECPTLTCNFRSGTWIQPEVRKVHARARTRMAAAFFILGLMLCGINAAWDGLRNAHEKNFKTQIRNIAGNMLPGTPIPRGQEVLIVQRGLTDQRRAYAPFRHAFEPSLGQPLRALLEKARQHGIMIEDITLKPDQVRIQGASDGWTDYRHLLEVLNTAGYKTGQPDRRDAGLDEKVHFTLEGEKTVDEH